MAALRSFVVDKETGAIRRVGWEQVDDGIDSIRN